MLFKMENSRKIYKVNSGKIRMKNRQRSVHTPAALMRAERCGVHFAKGPFSEMGDQGVVGQGSFIW